MIWLQIVVHLLSFSLCLCLCSDSRGNSVTWWILYQQKTTPFTHFYVDSSSKSFKTAAIHYPEKDNSVLSRAILSITKAESEYIIYSNDLINARTIAHDLKYPTYSKWMHGIIGTDSHWSSGMWILHNNLFFPPTKESTLTKPGSKAWYMATVGDSEADIFYICLSVAHKEEMENIFINVMAGNPFIITKHVNEQSFVNSYLTEMASEKSSAVFESAIKFAVNCMYADQSNITEHCLFKHTMNTKITILTRPRGLIYHSQTFCYAGQSRSMTSLMALERTALLKYELTESIFTIPDQDNKNGMSSSTCFGQDIAVNRESVAIMICVHDSGLFNELSNSIQTSKWACPVVSSIHNDSRSHTATSDKFCSFDKCGGSKKMIQAEELKVKLNKNPLTKNFKMAEWFHKMRLDLELKDKINIPSTSRQHRRPNQLINLIHSDDIKRYLVNNNNAVLGLFCQHGCRFCQAAKENMIRLRRILPINTLDIVLVNVRHPGVPPALSVPWTPFIRFKDFGSDEWKDYEDRKYDIKSIFSFLHKSMASERFPVEEYENTTTTDDENKDNRNTSFSFTHGHHDYRPTHNIYSRVKRKVDPSFMNKHVWQYSTIDNINEQDAIDQFERVKADKKLIPDFSIKKRKEHSFIVTTNRLNTQQELDAISTNIYAECISNNPDCLKGQSNLLLPKQIDVMDFNTSVALVHLTLRRSRVREDLIVIECVFDREGNFHVGGSITKSGFKLGHFDQIHLKTKRSCSKEVAVPDGTCSTES